MREIRIPDPRILNSEKTYLDADYTSGTSLTVINNIGFALNDIVIAGEPGEDHAEAQRVLSTTGSSTVNINASLNYSHNKGSTLYKTVWNQVSVERAGLNSSFSVLVVMDVMWDATETLYFDSTGDDTYSYRFRFYNSYSGTYSEYSSTVTGGGFSRKQAGQMIINARKKVRDPNINRFEDGDILTFLQDAQTQIEMLIPDLYFLRVDTFEQNTGITTIAGTYKYSMASYTDFNYFHKVQYKYNNGVVSLKWDLEPLPETEYDRYVVNQNRIADDNIRRYKLLQPDSSSANGYFETYPSPLSASGTLYPIYYRKLTALTNISVATDLPFPEILEDYAAWRMHVILGNEIQAEMYKKLFYGPDEESSSLQLTGIQLLRKYNTNRKLALGYGRNLWRYRGQRGRNNFWNNGLVTQDFVKENYM